MATWWWLCVCSLWFLLLMPCSLSEKFSLDGSPSPVVGVVGQDVVLPCQLSPPARLPSMDVLWRKIESGFIPVHEYSDEGSRDLPGESYQNRTELFPQEFSHGNISLKLKQLQEADAGTYHCFVKNPEWSQEATTDLGIAAVAPVFIDVLGPQDQGIGLACRTTGWFPKPELQWVGKNGQNLSMEIVTNVTQDRENLYSVVITTGTWAVMPNENFTLDAGTAHPNLSISDDKKSLKHEAQPQNVPPNPERFDLTVCVLGSEGFSSGEHSWAVDVSSSTDWDLGVAIKSIQRKGNLSLSPKEGFWVLGLSGRDYSAKTDPLTPVTVQKKPKKIRVYISYEEKRVTFFNETDKSVLFIFNDCLFSDAVYPFFKNSHKGTSMKILFN
ncbi:hypothetical protein KIL84_001550 [Mauremys mutica]|uniref:Uncharacterized protein n=1 Tax=Mauremys mutica TaxID=74926 RepID=A0A9D4B4W0_9SAUR|nr:hypothetical protein KIL84_001550 [Mauremys mutica]